MKIVADENIPLLEELYAGVGELLLLPGRKIDSRSVQDADLLLVRSVTRVDQKLLQGSSLRFVGSTTIGTDHIDTDFLASAGIGFCSAPGCNAEAVVDYVLCVMATLFRDNLASLLGKQVGIVGCGNVGGRLATRLKALGIQTICCDPPLANRGEVGLVTIEQLLEEADILTLHTPLTLTAQNKTLHLLDDERLNKLKTGAVLINTSRGAVVDNLALLRLLLKRSDIRCVLDVWENEPSINTDLLPLLALATPHIAGYSQEGKIRGALMVYRSVCDYFGVPVRSALGASMPAPLELPLSGNDFDSIMGLLGCLLPRAYDICGDDQNFRNTMLEAKIRGTVALDFDLLRKQYLQRREFGSIKPVGSQVTIQRRQLLRAAGFCC